MNSEEWKLDQLRRRAAVGRHRSIAGEDVADPATAAASRAKPFASVIVVCWNAADVLGRCIEHLLALDYPSYEIIVVDDGSDDASAHIARQASARGALTLVQSRRNRGCPSARNLGLKRARGEIVAFVDADGFASERWLSELVAAFGEDPSIGGIASTVFFDDNPLVVNGAGGIVNRQGWAADLSMNESYESADLAAEALYPMGCGMALRREAIERVGRFDERMLNYYDDVDYGTRLWRAGYRVEVAPAAWIDHGFGAAGGDSARKRLLCERHRMRVVLKHAAWPELRQWLAHEVRSLRRSSRGVRMRKLRAAAWNVRHLPSVLGDRRLSLGQGRVPERLIDRSWGDGFPAGVTPQAHPRAELARDGVDVADSASEPQLCHGWFPTEHVDDRSLRWASPHAGVLVRLPGGTRRMRVDCSHVPVDIGGIEVSLRRIGAADVTAPAWRTRLAWQYSARTVENHPMELAPGGYEVVFEAERGWSDPPRDPRSLAFALASLRFGGLDELCRGGVDMASASVEDQLLGGWFEPESSEGREFRWAGREGAALVCLDEGTDRARIVYRTPPTASGVTVQIGPLDGGDPACMGRLAPADGDWCEASLDVQLPPGDYVISLAAERTWSNPQGRDPSLWGENRTLGFALSMIDFVARGRADRKA
jgi:GT2 family glycosyltransferase